MKLKNPFPEEVRLFYLYDHRCFLCNSNGNGSLEIHHIMGRISDSIFNSFLLCNECHSRMNHSQKEEQELFAIIFKRCYNKGYKPNDNDFEFIGKNYNRLFTPKLEKWLENSI